MNIALHDSDKTAFPNLALMKISSFYKSMKGHEVSFYDPLFSNNYNIIYSSKVFTFTKQSALIGNVELGGTGYKCFSLLPEEIEHSCPDYSLYNLDYSLGFLTRGCPNKCSWCIVPRKEGDIKAHADIDEFLRHDKVILMDNNVLASDHGIKQIEKIAKLKIKVDFNQGVDARLIDDSIARLFSKVKWLRVRLACDKTEQIPAIEKAVRLMRWHNVRPGRYFVYCLIQDVSEAMERIKYLKGLYLEPFAQPFIDYNGNVKPTKEQKRLSRWVNQTAIFNSIEWEDYKYNGII